MTTSTPAALDRRLSQAELTVDGNPVGHLGVAGTSPRRLRGLFFSDREALLIVPSSSVHAIGFNHTLEVAYLNKEGVVVTVKTLKPWTMHLPVKGAFAALEARPGTFAKWRLTTGSRLEFTGEAG